MFSSDELLVTRLRFTTLKGGALSIHLAASARRLLLQESLALARAQRHYLQGFHQAESSLAWGLSQRWPARHGECRQHPAELLRVCLQASKRRYGWLLCGEGGGTTMAPPLRHYQRVTATSSRDASGNGGSIPPWVTLRRRALAF